MSTCPCVGVVALQGAVSEHAEVLASLGARVREVRTPEELDGLCALVLPGGESTAMARLAAQVDLFPAVRERVIAGMPVLGTCAGMVLLADHVEDGAALKGFPTIPVIDMTVRRNAYGGQLGSFTAALTLSGMGDPYFPAVFIRAPQVIAVGPQVDVVGRTGDDEGPVVAVREGNVLATTFHPELTDDTRFHQLLLDLA